VIQPGGVAWPFGEIFGRHDRYPMMLVIIGEKDETAGVEDDPGAQNNAIPLHHRIEIGLRA
jgi:hypothetical protein